MYNVLSYFKLNENDSEYTSSLENVCRTQLEAQSWVDSMTEAYDDMMQEDLVKLVTHYEEEIAKRGKDRADILLSRAIGIKNIQARQKIIIYVPQTKQDFIDTIDFDLGLSKLVKELVKSYPEYIEDVYA